MNFKHAFTYTFAYLLGLCALGPLAAQDAETRQQLERIRREVNRNSFVPNQLPNSRHWEPSGFRNDLPFDAQSDSRFPGTDMETVDLLMPEFPRVQLIRGSQVLEISNDALYQSGLFDAAIHASPELSGRLQAIRSTESRLNQIKYEQNRAAAAGNDDLAKAIQRDARAARQHLMDQQAGFAQALQRQGVNGAQVATVASDGILARQRHVLIQAIRSTPGNNLGYATTRIYPNGQLGMTTVPSEYLLPTPVDANDLFFSNANGTQRLQDGVMLNVTDEPRQNPIARILAMPRFGLFYDTGKAPTARGNFAKGVSLQGRDDPAAGQTDFLQRGGTAETQFDLLFDTQVLDVGGHTLQFFTDANNDRDIERLDVEHLGFRAYNRNRGSLLEGWLLVVGKTHSLFSQEALRLTSVLGDTTLIGTADRNNKKLSQIAVHIPVCDEVQWKIAVEDPYLRDMKTVTGANLASTLTRWPTVSTNLAWASQEHHHMFQLGGITRTLGFQDTAGAEHFGTAWGLSAAGRIGPDPDRGLYFGVAGGDGVGSYIQGIEYSSVAGPSSLDTISGIGTFAGYRDIRSDPNGKKISEVNVAYGYSWTETPDLLGSTVDQRLQQGWVNYLRFFSDYMALGFEYQYGYRQVVSGDQGEDHRFLAVIALRSGPTKNSTAVAEGASALSQAFRIGGRSVSDVVYQDQRGGPTYMQQF
ncbi:MAG: hypothetical protein ACC628_01590 [Pirellulaceae bacterium]